MNTKRDIADYNNKRDQYKPYQRGEIGWSKPNERMEEIDTNLEGNVVNKNQIQFENIYKPNRFADSKNTARQNYQHAYNYVENSAKDNYQQAYNSLYENTMADEIVEGAAKIFRGAMAPIKKFINADVDVSFEEKVLDDEETVSAETSENAKERSEHGKESGKKYEKTTQQKPSAKPTTTQRTKLSTKVLQDKKDKATNISPCLTKSGKPIDDDDLKKVLDFVDAVTSSEKVVGNSKT